MGDVGTDFGVLQLNVITTAIRSKSKERTNQTVAESISPLASARRWTANVSKNTRGQHKARVFGSMSQTLNWEFTIFNTLKPSGNYMYRVLNRSVALHFVFMSFIRFWV
jgi:hypothetical protein